MPKTSIDLFMEIVLIDCLWLRKKHEDPVSPPVCGESALMPDNFTAICSGGI
jgi:hypothetical protein